MVRIADLQGHSFSVAVGYGKDKMREVSALEDREPTNT